MKRLRSRLRLLRRYVRRRRQRRKILGMIPKLGVGVEVGVWKGDNAAALLKQTKSTHLTLIDPWEHMPDLKGWYGKRSSQEAMDAVHRSVCERFADDQRVTVERSSSLAFREHFDAKLDWAYIDGDHRYEGALADLHAYWPLIRPGGCMAGDDYMNKGWWDHGVTKAVDEFRSTVDCEFVVLGDQYLLRKPYSNTHRREVASVERTH